LSYKFTKNHNFSMCNTVQFNPEVAPVSGLFTAQTAHIYKLFFT